MTAQKTTLFSEQKNNSVDYLVLMFRDGKNEFHLYHPQARRDEMISLCSFRKSENGVEILNFGPRSKFGAAIVTEDGREYRFCPKCEEHRKRGNELYAIAVEECVKGKWEARMEYSHGKDSATVRQMYLALHGSPRLRVVACGPAIGYLAADDKGSVLIA